MPGKQDVAGTPERKKDGTWAKGVSGNPAGRAKGRPTLAWALRHKLAEPVNPDDPEGKTWLDVVAEQTLAGALKGDKTDKKLLYNYHDGKAPQAIEITGADGGPVQTVDLSKLDPDQLKALYALLEIAESPDEE